MKTSFYRWTRRRAGLAGALLLVLWGAGAVRSAPLVPPAALHARILAGPVHTVTLSGGLIAGGELDTVTPGYPAHLVRLALSGAAEGVWSLPGAYGAWGFAKGPGGAVEVGTYPQGEVFRVGPAGGPRLVCRLPGVTMIWAMAADPVTGRMYAGTFPDGGVWQTGPGGCRRLASLRPAGAPAVSVRALTAQGGVIYAGTGPMAQVYALTPGDSPRPLLPAPYPRPGQVDGLAVLGGRLEVLLGNGTLLSLSPAGQLQDVLSDVEGLPLTLPGLSDPVALRDGILYGLNLGSPNHQLVEAWASLPLPVARTLVAWGASGASLYGLTKDGTLIRMDPATGQVTDVPLSLPASPGVIQTLAAVPGSGVWGSAYLGGQLFHLDPSGHLSRFVGLPQVDAILPVGNALYLAAYPNAELYQYVPSQAWNPGQNPRLVAVAEEEQDRPFALAYAGGQIYMGTVPKGGIRGGALLAYSPETHAERLLGDPVPGQSVVSLTADGPYLVGATSVFGGLGSPPAPGPAALFRLNAACGCDLVRYPLPGQETVAGLWTAPSGQVYALTHDEVVRLDPATGRLTVRPFSRVGWQPGSWGSMTHLVSLDGMLFAVVNGNLMRVNPRTLATRWILYGVQQAAVYGQVLYLSYRSSTDLLELPAGPLAAYGP